MSRNLDSYSQAYFNQPFEPVMVHYRRKRTLDILGDLSACRILEIGCGTEPASSWIPAFQSLTVLEPAEDFYQSALRYAAGNPLVRIIQASAEQAGNLNEAPFDVILLSSLLHELQHPEWVLNALHPWCHTETRILVNVPNAWSFHRHLAVKMGLISSPETLSPANLTFQQARVFQMPELIDLCRQCGYEVTLSLTSFIKPFTHAQMQKMIEDELLPVALLDGLYHMSSEMPDSGAEIFLVLKSAQ
jgi:2-polyprenyl-3-methyl-5-hydroxy-6-metoxy-1,4-benzoquinol methylase